MGELFRSKIQAGMPLAVDLRLEATRLAKDVEWGSRFVKSHTPSDLDTSTRQDL